MTKNADDSCKPCRWFQKPRKIEWARHYATVAKRLDTALADGVLAPDPDKPYGAWAPETPYVEMRQDELTGKGMPDMFDYNFRCNHCGRRYNLVCNIYHGAGGHWKML